MGYLRDVFLEDTQSVGVGHHHGGHGVVEQRAQVIDIDSAVGTALYLYNFQAGDGCRRRVGTVGRVGHNHLAALCVTAALVVAANHHQAGELAVSAGEGVERKFAHAADFAKGLLESPVSLQGALHCRSRRERMESGKSAVRGDLLVEFRIILHSARPQRIEAGVDTEVIG